MINKGFSKRKKFSPDSAKRGERDARKDEVEKGDGNKLVFNAKK